MVLSLCLKTVGDTLLWSIRTIAWSVSIYLSRFFFFPLCSPFSTQIGLVSELVYLAFKDQLICHQFHESFLGFPLFTPTFSSLYPLSWNGLPFLSFLIALCTFIVTVVIFHLVIIVYVCNSPPLSDWELLEQEPKLVHLHL